MLEMMHTMLAFVVAIAVLVAAHEYGHFIVARRLGIRVEKFSIGFGPALLSWRSRDGEVLYVIAAIPLGGYVKMLGENPHEQGDEAKQALSPEERLRAFDAQPVWKRASVSVAGPLFNFLFAILAFMIVGWVGQYVTPTVIGAVSPASVAEQAVGTIVQTLIIVGLAMAGGARYPGGVAGAAVVTIAAVLVGVLSGVERRQVEIGQRHGDDVSSRGRGGGQGFVFAHGFGP